uniref:Uncharacterized protein n=1 Tax=Aegilops tauschii subsp. strangulata TaxID=200361 RepID=A0A453FBP1_AEGTS
EYSPTIAIAPVVGTQRTERKYVRITSQPHINCFANCICNKPCFICMYLAPCPVYLKSGTRS